MSNNPPYINNNMPNQQQEQQPEQSQGGWFSNPLMKSVWGYTSKAIEKGS